MSGYSEIDARFALELYSIYRRICNCFCFFFCSTRGVLEIDLTRFNLFNHTMLTFSLQLDVLLKKETVPLVYSTVCGLFSLINREPKQPIFINIPFFQELYRNGIDYQRK